MHVRMCLTVAALAAVTGCAANRPALRATLEPLTLAENSPSAADERESVVRVESAHSSSSSPSPTPAPEQQALARNPFLSDSTSAVSEAFLAAAVDDPISFAQNLRVGVVNVVGRYEPDLDISTFAVPAQLTAALEQTGRFDLATEVASDFPADRGISGLRELAARYRTRYLLIYRHRFVEDSYLNPAAWSFLTGVGALFVPGNTIESAGIVEASLFDVKTGVVLFTVNERVHATSAENVWNEQRKQRWLKERLLREATTGLTRQVALAVERLATKPRAGENAAAPRPAGEVVRLQAEGP